eukprot:6183072-Pleurochrysis_carterae.AAC.1
MESASAYCLSCHESQPPIPPHLQPCTHAACLSAKVSSVCYLSRCWTNIFSSCAAGNGRLYSPKPFVALLRMSSHMASMRESRQAAVHAAPSTTTHTIVMGRQQA